MPRVSSTARSESGCSVDWPRYTWQAGVAQMS